MTPPTPEQLEPAKTALLNIILYCCHWNKVESADKPSNENWNYQITKPEAEKYIQEAIDKSVESLQQQLAEAKERLKCDVCGGNGTPISGLKCICKGTGLIQQAIFGYREELYDTEKQLEKFEQERDKLQFIVQEQRKALEMCHKAMWADDNFEHYDDVEMQRVVALTPSNLPRFVLEEKVLVMIKEIERIKNDYSSGDQIRISLERAIERFTKAEKEGV